MELRVSHKYDLIFPNQTIFASNAFSIATRYSLGPPNPEEARLIYTQLTVFNKSDNDL